jgi:hypothetical protein
MQDSTSPSYILLVLVIGYSFESTTLQDSARTMQDSTSPSYILLVLVIGYSFESTTLQDSTSPSKILLVLATFYWS